MIINLRFIFIFVFSVSFAPSTSKAYDHHSNLFRTSITEDILATHPVDTSILDSYVAKPVGSLINIIITVALAAVALGCLSVCVAVIAYRLSSCPFPACCRCCHKKSGFSFDPMVNPQLIVDHNKNTKVIPRSNENKKSAPNLRVANVSKYPVPPESPSLQPHIPKSKHSDGNSSPPQISHSASPSSHNGSSGDIDQHVVQLQDQNEHRAVLQDKQSLGAQSNFSTATDWTLPSDVGDFSLPNLPELDDGDDGTGQPARHMNQSVELPSMVPRGTDNNFGEDIRRAANVLQDNRTVPKSSDLNKVPSLTNTTLTNTTLIHTSIESEQTDRVTVKAGEMRYSGVALPPDEIPRASSGQGLQVDDHHDDDVDQLYYSAESLPGPRMHSESSLGFVNISGVIGSVPPSLKNSINPQVAAIHEVREELH